ncbi:MAG: 2-oxoacid:ferredoxin oxidoreductase subunit beta [Anaerolineae bacterium]|nr:2-oxoacid:ferredoxin oxidoreductase subunit beta [Anaerolineae bacterium]
MGVVRTTNAIGLTKADYGGRKSTLCPGCGHNSISNQIITAAYELGINPHTVVKMSGIGCSSKSPAYFLSRSHGFNGLHGRMPSAATGAVLANRHLTTIGVSGDGDTGSIGLGQFKHMVRRNLPIVYIVENNGVYGLTKGQFSATADLGQTIKKIGTNDLPPIDICLEALAADATFVARSFSGSVKEVVELLKAALHHNGTAVLDIISPCVTFNNSPDSTKSFSYGKEHANPLHDITFIPLADEIILDDYEEAESNGKKPREVQLHDGTWIRLRPLAMDYDPTDKMAAMRVLEEAHLRQELLTGLIYYDNSRPTMIDSLQMVDTPLAHLSEAQMRPSREALEQVMASL